MGRLAARASLGPTLGYAAGGWLFAASPQHGFGWLALPLALLFGLLFFRRTLRKTIKSFDRNQPREVTS
jgi:hypothetical protein